jgi:hypothetical protein
MMVVSRIDCKIIDGPADDRSNRECGEVPPAAAAVLALPQVVAHCIEGPAYGGSDNT